MRCPNCGFKQADTQGDTCVRCGYSGEEKQRTGPAWEHRQSAVDIQAILNTLSGVLFRPVETFRGMKRTGGLGGPLLYAVILGTLGGWLSVLWNSFFHSLGVLGEGLGDEEIVSYITFLVLAFMMPFLMALIVFIGSAITHVCLLLVGASTKSFETTFRVSSYAIGSTEILNFIPLCGGLIGGVWYIVAMIIGVREAHGISTGKAVVGVLLPLIVCCSCLCLILFIGFGAVLTEFIGNL